jgi:hypothetical protein
MELSFQKTLVQACPAGPDNISAAQTQSAKGARKRAEETREWGVMVRSKFCPHQRRREQ